MKNFFTNVFGNSPEEKSTWNYHLWVSLFIFLTLSTFGWQPAYFYRTLFLLERYPAHLIPNWLLMLSISVALGLLLRKKIIHFCVLFTIFFIFATASRMKFEALGFPLLAMDLTLTKYSDIFVQYLTPGKILGALVCLVVPIFLLNFRYKGRPSLYSKVMVFPNLFRFERRGLLCLILSLPIWFGLSAKGYFGFAGIKLYTSAQWPLEDYMGDGDLVAFTLSFYSNQNYVRRYQLREETAKRIEAEVTHNNIAPQCQTTERPDIMVVMVESMFDPIQIPNVTFNKDPLAPLRNLGFEESKSYFFVPAYGGNTANTEFEFLTGSTHRFFGPGTIQYQHHLYTPANSLARLLKEKNYRSMAVHNYYRHFWRRQEVYPLLGFEEFYGLEDLQKFGSVTYYDNIKLYNQSKPQDKILVTFLSEEMKKRQAEPGFYFVVTMGTHGPYHKYLKDASTSISLKTKSGVDDQTLDSLTNYTNFLADSSDALSDLFRFALGRTKPTIIVFFGDHLPALPSEVYSKTGYLDWMKRELDVPVEAQKIVPVHVLNNFGCKIELPKTIASNCMASNLVAQLYSDMPKDQFWKYNLEFCKKHPMVFDGIDPSKLDGDFADYAALIYQNLFKWGTKAAAPTTPQ